MFYNKSEAINVARVGGRNFFMFHLRLPISSACLHDDDENIKKREVVVRAPPFIDRRARLSEHFSYQ